MKKVINKYRNGTISNPQYSLNYKFDSISSAGKINGTALELIKKYNELAKEAHSNGNYTEMENFRQYAEHYRKIVTDINEKKSNFKPVTKPISDDMNKEEAEVSETAKEQEHPAEETVQNISDTEKTKSVTKVKKSLKVVEIVKKEEEKPIKRKVVRKKTTKKEEA